MTTKLKEDAILINLKLVADRLEALEDQLNRITDAINVIHQQINEINTRSRQHTTQLPTPLKPWQDKTIYPADPYAPFNTPPYFGTQCQTGADNLPDTTAGGNID